MDGLSHLHAKGVVHRDPDLRASWPRWNRSFRLWSPILAYLHIVASCHTIQSKRITEEAFKESERIHQNFLTGISYCLFTLVLLVDVVGSIFKKLLHLIVQYYESILILIHRTCQVIECGHNQVNTRVLVFYCGRQGFAEDFLRLVQLCGARCISQSQLQPRVPWLLPECYRGKMS